MRYLSVCSGIEAATVAWHPLGWTPAAFSEIEAFPRAVLAHHYPDVPLHGDFTTIEGKQYGPIDLLVGGTPCQDFSVAGLRAGIAGDRGNLTLEFLRLAARTQPRWIVWENVPGVLSSDGGRALGAFLGGLAELGCGFAYRVLDAQFFGLAQRRARVFVIGYFGDWRRAAAVLFERESLLGHPAPRREAGKGVAASVIKGAAIGRQPHNGPQYGDTISDGSCYTLNCTEQHAVIAPTLSARTKGGGGLGTDFDCDGGLIAADVAQCLETTCNDYSRADGFNMIAFDTTQITSKANRSNPQPEDTGSAVRRLTPTECERLQGFPDDYTLVSYRNKPANDGPRYKSLGNSMAVPVMAWIGQRIAMVERMSADSPTGKGQDTQAGGAHER